MITIIGDKVAPSKEACATIGAKDYLTKLVSPPPVMTRVVGEKFKWEPVQKEPLRIIEASSGKDSLVVDAQPIHQFVSAALCAYKSHYPFILNPDTFWITITQGLANHINANAEA
jgi:hypothetical protein